MLAPQGMVLHYGVTDFMGNATIQELDSFLWKKDKEEREVSALFNQDFKIELVNALINCLYLMKHDCFPTKKKKGENQPNLFSLVSTSSAKDI